MDRYRDNTVAAVRAGVDTRSLLAVEVATLASDAGFDFDLYQSLGGKHFEPFRPAHTPMTDDDQQRLLLNGTQVLYVDPDGDPAYIHYLGELLDDLPTWIDRPMRTRCETIVGCATQTVRRLLATPRELPLYRWARKTAAAVAQLILEEPAAAIFLLQSLRHGPAISTHMVNVSIMAAALAARMGIENADELQRIALGGLLHDLGKTRIPHEILASQLPLTEEQMVQLRLHPDHGLQLAYDTEGMNRETAGMIHQHHERLDGTGYPIGLVADDLSQASRICAVVDVYDAMSNPRPYRDPLPTEYIMQYLTEQAPGRLDGGAVGTWVEIVRQVANPGAGPTVAGVESDSLEGIL